MDLVIGTIFFSGGFAIGGAYHLLRQKIEERNKKLKLDTRRVVLERFDRKKNFVDYNKSDGVFQ